MRISIINPSTDISDKSNIYQTYHLQRKHRGFEQTIDRVRTVNSPGGPLLANALVDEREDQTPNPTLSSSFIITCECVVVDLPNPSIRILPRIKHRRVSDRDQALPYLCIKITPIVHLENPVGGIQGW
jgi:hypothetical protein